MQNTTSTIIAIFTAAVLLFIVPLVTLTDRNDNVTQEKVKLIVEEFVTDVRNTGKLTRTKFQELENRLDSSGNNAYSIEIEIKYLDENPGKKTAQANYSKIGENVYYSEYTTQILKKIGVKTGSEDVDSEDDTIMLKQGDFIAVDVKNVNSTAAQTLKSSFLSFSNAGEYVINASSSGMVTVNGTKNYLVSEEISEDEIPEDGIIKNEYIITYDANGGTGAPAPQVKKHGKNIALSTEVPTRIGYTFAGWAKNNMAEPGAGVYQPGENYTVNGDVTLYAVWSRNYLAINYYSNYATEAFSGALNTVSADANVLVYTHYFWYGDSCPNGLHDYTYSTAKVYLARKGFQATAYWGTSPDGGTLVYQGTGFNYCQDVAEAFGKDISKGNASINLYAQWTKTYTVTYNANGGTGAPDSQTKVHGKPLTLSTTKPTKTGYTFSGWTTIVAEGTIEYRPGDEYTGNNNVTLYAVWRKNYLTINYYSNYATEAFEGALNAVSADKNVIVRSARFCYDDECPSGLHDYVELSAKTYLARTGFKPTGYWGTSPDGGTLIHQGTGFEYCQDVATAFGKDISKGDASINLYAQWIETYIVSYDANGGEGAPGSQTKTHGEALTLSSVEPTREGHYFLGWATTSTATSATYQPGDSYTENLGATLYAVWEPETYAINYSANGGTGAPESQTKTYGVELILSSTKPTREGYTFLGWATSSTATTAQYQPKDSYTENSPAVLYAVWKINTYTISYNANGGTGVPESQTKTYGVDLTLSSTKPTLTGYDFLGWATSSTATTATYQPGDSYTANASTTLYAVWNLQTYTISYNANGGTGAPSSQTKTYGKALTLSNTEPTREGYTFLGWSTSSTATAATYEPGELYTENSEATLYAVWKINTYTISYNANGGTGAPSSQTKTHGTALTLSSTKPTRTGYTFLGWSTSSTATSATYSAGGTFTTNANTTLYAVWEAKTYTITYTMYDMFYEKGDIGTTISENIKYTITDDVVTVTAITSTNDRKEGYGPITYRVNLEADTTYMFSCKTNGTWGGETGTDTVEAFLLLNGGYETYYRMRKTDNYTFTPTVSGTYYLRLDVNTLGKTYTFADIRIAKVVKISEIAYNNTYGNTMTELTRDGYSFVGWYDESYVDNPLNYYADTYSDLKTAYGYDEDSLYNHYKNTGKSEGRRISQYISTDKVTTDKILYGYMKPGTYTISYNANGGTGEIASQTKTHGTAITLSSTKLTRTGYTFLGWSTSSTATTATYQPGDSYTANSSATLYAVWKAKTITTTFDKNDGSGTTATQTFTYGVSGQSFSNKNWTRSGYELLGWAYSKDATAKDEYTLAGVTDDWIDKYSPSVTLYAVWEKTSYYIINTASTPDYGSATFNSWTENEDTATAGWVSGTSTTNGNITCSVNSRTSTGGITIYGNNSTIGYNAALVKTKTTVPSSEYSKMYITYKVSGNMSGKTLFCGLSSNSGTTGHLTYNTTQSNAVYKTLSTSQTTTTTVSLDISSVTTDQYLYAYMHNPSNTSSGYLYITKVWFE